MRRLLLSALIVLLAAAGCQSAPPPAPPEPPSAPRPPEPQGAQPAPRPPQAKLADLTGVNRVELEAGITRERMPLKGERAAAVAAAFAASPATATDAMPACAPELSVRFLRDDAEVARGHYNRTGSCYAVIYGEGAIRHPGIDLERLLDPIATLLNRGLTTATALVTGAGQTDTATITAPETIARLAAALTAAPPVASDWKGPGSLAFIWFLRENRPFAHLWVQVSHDTKAPMAIRFDEEQEWWKATPEVAAALQPILSQIPPPKTP